MTRREILMRLSLVALLMLSAEGLYGSGGQNITGIGDLELNSGDTVENCFVGWRSFGVPNADSSNTVLFPTWFGGISAHLKNLCGEGSIVDSSKYWVIALDALGNGVSSSPSNSGTQPGSAFPRISMEDMVRSQYILLTEKLGINHVRAVIGGSMGGMQAFNWAVLYPEYMDKVIPYVGTPRASASDMVSWTIQARMIDEGLKCGMPDSVIIKSVNLLQHMIVYTPEFRSLETPYEEIGNYIDGISCKFGSTYTIENFRWQLEAMITNNVTANFGNSYSATADHVKASFLIIVNRQDHIVSPIPPLQFADALKAKRLVLDNNRGHLGITPEMEKVSYYIQRFLDE